MQTLCTFKMDLYFMLKFVILQRKAERITKWNWTRDDEEKEEYIHMSCVYSVIKLLITGKNIKLK